MVSIDKKLIFLFIISLNEYLVEGEHLKGYYFNKSQNKYFKIESTSTTVKPKFTTTTTEPSSIKRNDDLKKLGINALAATHTHSTNVQTANAAVASTAAEPTAPPSNQTTVHAKPPAQTSSYESPDMQLEMERPKINMLDFISGMSKAIHLLLYQREPMKGSLDSQESSISETNQTASGTREPISIFRTLKVNSKVPPEGLPSDYRGQAELLRQQIIRRCNQLQNIIKTTNEILRERENHMFVKILDNFSSRIEHTKTRADLILKDTHTSTAAVKALNRINYGLNNMNHLVQNVLSRVNISINLDMLKENQKESKREAKRLRDKSHKNHSKNDKKETSSAASTTATAADKIN